jgi:two-component system nitrate/nitrite response regulator NarL
MRAAPIACERVRMRTVHVVTVDDQAAFREAAGAMIDGTAGFELVGEAADGESALRVVREVDPDMVLVDVRMPGIDGIELARRLREEDPTRVIVLASSTDPHELSQLARACGAAALVHKHWLTPRLLRGLWIAHRRR